jgi:hypothetical protein
MIHEILSRTPTWVWALLAGLLALGLAQWRERRVTQAQLFILPGVLLALGLWSTAQSSTMPALALLVWAKAALVTTTLARRLPPQPGVRWDAAAQRLVLPGSVLPLVVILAVFSLRYAGGVALAMHPVWRADPAVALPMAAAYGAISGLLLGRALGLRRLVAAPL